MGQQRLHNQTLAESIEDDDRVALGKPTITTGCKNVLWSVFKTLIWTYIKSLADAIYVTITGAQTITGHKEFNSITSIRIGNYVYLGASTDADTVNDIRFSNLLGFLTWQKCTVASATKGSGGWAPIFPYKLTQNYTVIGDSNNLVSEIQVKDTLVGFGTLINGEYIINSSLIKASTSYILLTPTTNGTLTGTLKVLPFDGQAIIYSKDATNQTIVTDNVKFFYKVY